MIELRNVYKRVGSDSDYAVDDVSCAVNRGGFLGLIGESGCGKTTTLKLINRLVEPTEGEILVGGESVQTQQPEILRRNIGYVFQGVGLFPHFSIEENVGAVPTLLGWDPVRIQQRCREMLDLVGLPFDDFAVRSPGELSGGQQQRVGVARALAAEPEVLLMDEPFGALDPITRAGLQDEFKSIQKSMNLTVIMVTHDMTEALLMADRIAVMKAGRILQLGSPENLLHHTEDDYVNEIVAMPKQRAHLVEQLIEQPPNASEQ